MDEYKYNSLWQSCLTSNYCNFLAIDNKDRVWVKWHSGFVNSYDSVAFAQNFKPIFEEVSDGENIEKIKAALDEALSQRDRAINLLQFRPERLNENARSLYEKLAKNLLEEVAK